MAEKKLSSSEKKESRFFDFEISDNCLTVLKSRYLRKNLETKEIIEEPKDLFVRVAKAIAAGSKASNPNISKSELEHTEDKFYRLMASFDFLPNSPTLMNAGRELPNLSACFVLPVEDSMEGIFNTLKHAALIHKSGGGTGFDFSRLRPEGSNVKTTAGSASGPISFMSVFNAATETIKQGGVRRGANMGILRVDHPDIMSFISCKEDVTKFTNFNISVAVTDEFMAAYKNGTSYNLYNKDWSVNSKKSAKEVMDKIVHHAWSTGEPGIVFIDKVNKKSTIPGVGKIEATNPCGEQPLLPYEACNLGSVNVSNFYDKEKNEIDWSRLGSVVKDCIHFLDNVIDVGQYPIPEIHEVVKNNRKVGLGIMGFADLLYKLRIPYDSNEGVELGKKLMSFIHEHSVAASVELAKVRGPFPNVEFSTYPEPMRNSAVTTVAPTGTIGMIAEASGGIEPNFALVYVKQVLDGKKLLYVNPVFKQTLIDAGLYSDDLMEKISMTGQLSDIEEIPEDLKKVFVTAQEISPYYHVAMQSAFQESVDSSISKTINFSYNATKSDILDAYIQAYDSECKGITVYRDGCRPYQVLNTGNKTNEDKKKPEVKKVENSNVPMYRPDVIEGKTYKTTTGEGTMYVTVNTIDGVPFEIFSSIGKAGGNSAAQSEAVSRLVSLALRSRISVEVIVDQLLGIGSPTPVWHNGEKILSTPDAVAKILKRYIKDENSLDIEQIVEEKHNDGPVCPKCNGTLHMQEGCLTCHTCGFSKCS
ncbi:MAG: vitamin B12-dependent ribonucleotide reductase [Candidatus Delongbacteria bacterium]|nr:vitamin B12-dependent ribonucleotide reductase [Candidatus Delongbacteria bacterium]MBN2834525.1 vitamin B12-dependent ribonucleotide reductase [Candidatus Delongbacteria bacterium]